MGETTRTDEEIELAELRELSAFFRGFGHKCGSESA